MSTAIYLINHSTNTQKATVTPFEMGFKVKSMLDHLRVFGSRVYTHTDTAKRKKIEPKSFRWLLLGYPENVKGYRVFGLYASKLKVSRFVKLDKRNVDGIYDTQSAQNGTVIRVTTDADEAFTLAPMESKPVVEEPIEGVDNGAVDVEMESMQPVEDAILPLLMPGGRSAPTGLELEPYCGPPTIFEGDRVVLHPLVDRSRRSCEPVFSLEDNEKERKSKGSGGPPFPKSAKIDVYCLIAEAVL